MKGTVAKVIHHILATRAGENPIMVNTTKTKLILKGLNPNKFTLETEDDPAAVAKAYMIAQEMGVELGSLK